MLSRHYRPSLHLSCWLILLKAFCNSQNAPDNTLAPSIQPTCVLERNTENCPSLIANNPPLVLPPECGLDACLNYCDGEYRGCCALDDTECSIECGVSGSSVEPITITAGCQLDPLGQLPPLAPVTAPTPTPTSISTPELPKECAFQRNVENCPALLSTQEPLPNCGPDTCLNYCNGMFQGCCDAQDNECSVQCSTNDSSDPIVITAGCRFNNTEGASSMSQGPVAAPVPTPALPTMPRECVLRRNIENCPTILASQEALLPSVTECSPDACLNFCNNEYVNCCELSDTECSMRCSGSNVPITITAGCRLGMNESGNSSSSSSPPPPSPPASSVNNNLVCAFYGQRCNNPSDCCSGQCVFGSCQRSAPMLSGGLRGPFGGEQNVPQGPEGTPGLVAIGHKPKKWWKRPQN